MKDNKGLKFSKAKMKQERNPGAGAVSVRLGQDKAPSDCSWMRERTVPRMMLRVF